MTDNSLTLVRPIKVGSATVSALALDAGFRVGWLRGAPKTPTWLIAVVRSLLASLPEDMTEADIRGDNKALFANFPSPSAEELDEVIPLVAAHRRQGDGSAAGGHRPTGHRGPVRNHDASHARHGRAAEFSDHLGDWVGDFAGVFHWRPVDIDHLTLVEALHWRASLLSFVERTTPR